MFIRFLILILIFLCVNVHTFLDREKKEEEENLVVFACAVVRAYESV